MLRNRKYQGIANNAAVAFLEKCRRPAIALDRVSFASAGALALFLLVGFLTPEASAQEAEAIECPYHEEIPVSFVDWNSDDRLSIDLLGSDCFKAVRVVTVHSSEGEVVYTNAIKLQRLAVQSLSHDDTMNDVLVSIRGSVTGRSTKDMPEFGSPRVEPDTFNQGGEENRSNYEKARSADQPLMCVRLGYESWECFWYDATVGYAKFLYWFGA